MSLGLFELMLIFFVLAPLAGAVAHRIKVGAAATGTEDEVPGPDEIRELREEIEELRGRVDRLSKEQRFLVRLLDERPDLSLEDGSGERPTIERTRPR